MIPKFEFFARNTKAMHLIVHKDNRLTAISRVGTRDYPCAIGRSGLIKAAQKREGDGASPIGRWPLKHLYYRADRLARPVTELPCTIITQRLGWCDAPADPAYNRLVTLPYAASHETLWREDHAYDLIVELGHNDAPPVPGLGSAIFLHVAKPGYTPTEGCIALAVEDLLAVLIHCTAASILDIRAP